MHRTAELVLALLEKDARGRFVFSPASAAELKRALDAIRDPLLLQEAIAELVKLACFLATEPARREAARAMLRVAESACAVAGLQSNATTALQDYRRMIGDDRSRAQPQPTPGFRTVKLKEVMPWQPIR